MSKLGHLLRQYCPDGVEKRALSEIAEIKRGERVTKAALAKDGKYPVISGGESPLGRLNKANREGGTITIASYGAAGYVNYIREKFWANDVCICVFPLQEIVLNKYLYYALKSKQYYLYGKTTKAVPDHIETEVASNTLIPVPPLPVQQEIVRILDSFTNYTAELTAELTARRKQYEYYRDYLLNFDVPHAGELGRLLRQYCPGGVKELKVSDLFLMRNGYTPSTKVDEYWNGDTCIPWVRMDDIRARGQIINDASRHITKAAVKKSGLFKAGSIIMATTATVGEHALLTADLLANQRFTNFEIRELHRSEVLTKYVYYYFFILDEWAKKHADIGNFMSVDIEELGEQYIPVPPLPVQDYIVSVLDQFETLTNDITKGLPAEVDARQKQYEYYRDKILSFDTI